MSGRERFTANDYSRVLKVKTDNITNVGIYESTVKTLKLVAPNPYIIVGGWAPGGVAVRVLRT